MVVPVADSFPFSFPFLFPPPSPFGVRHHRTCFGGERFERFRSRESDDATERAPPPNGTAISGVFVLGTAVRSSVEPTTVELTSIVAADGKRNR